MKNSTLVNILASIILIPISFWVIGNAFRDIWLWFIVPLGMSPLTFWHAIGINLILGIGPAASSVSVLLSVEEKKEKPPSAVRILVGIIFYLLVWGMSYFYHYMMGI